MSYRGVAVPGTGIEPVRIAPSVFETDASTDSAIRALDPYVNIFCRMGSFTSAKLILYFKSYKYYL